jgi:heat shock protein HspQ
VKVGDLVRHRLYPHVMGIIAKMDDHFARVVNIADNDNIWFHETDWELMSEGR